MNRLPDFNGVAPRISALDLARFKGQYVTIVGKPYKMDAVEGLLMHDVVSNEKMSVLGFNDSDNIAQINEFVVYVNPASSALQYHSHGTCNDDFDIDAYKRLLDLIPKYPGIF
jgi:hypothetical protein